MDANMDANMAGQRKAIVEPSTHPQKYVTIYIYSLSLTEGSERILNPQYGGLLL
jgi:hypothetical protein